MKILLDTNVLVSGLLNAAGSPGRVVDGLLLGELQLACDDRIVAEYRDVLARPRFKFDPAHCDRVLSYLVENCERVVAPPLPVTLPDASDQAFLEVAAHARADALVTGNMRHFPPDMRCSLTVLTPAELLVAWGKARSASGGAS